ncbi:hypothetical protein BDV98DRAFT_571914 [Pterulicium gracile]|uniref:CST complex subunit Ten1 n=1 Tax=Pterulicium gracile TaxID=1884261 RepID=A0A5C3QCV6_9AGAR|nr:hypothetical protein BDV98DRAFT_571914 [Pterula gracilis]
MPQQTDPAYATRLSSVPEYSVGSKVRVAGRILSYDSSNVTILLVDGRIGIRINVSLCLADDSHAWLSSKLAQVMIIGHLEQPDVSNMPPRTAKNGLFDVTIVQSVVMNAILVNPVPELDIGLWNASLDEMERVYQ